MKSRFTGALAAAFALAAAAFGQSRPQSPSPAPINRPAIPGRPGAPSARPAPAPAAKAKAAAPAKAVTQPDGKGSLPVIPYDDSPNALNFQDASADLVIMEYALRTGRTVLKAPNVPQTTITLRTTPDRELTDEQYLLAIREVLNLHGIVLKEEGDSFLRVVAAAEAGQHALPTEFAGEDGVLAPSPENGAVVQKMIELKYIGIDEAQPVISTLTRQGARIQTIERTNSILVTDSAENVNRVVEILSYMDKPVVAREEPNIRPIRFAKAADIKARLEEVVNEAKGDENASSSKAATATESRNSGSPGIQRRQLPPGVTFRNRDRDRDEDSGPSTPESVASLVADAAKGILRGKVAIIADERTNLLIILTRPENMVFFDKLIEVLDVPTAPEHLFEVVRLEHAVAEDMASLLNDWIGKSKTSESDAKPGVRSSRDSGGDSGGEKGGGAAARPGRSGGAQTGSGMSYGLVDPDNISILADEHSNSLIISANASDMAYLLAIVGKLDIQLSQVVIEAVIVSVTFKDSLETGMDWVQRAMIDSVGENGPGLAFATSGGGGSGTPLATAGLTTVDSVPRAGGVTGYFTVFDWNTDFVLKAVKNDSNARLMSSPRVTTMDNKEATLEATDRIYWTGETTHYASSDYTSQSIKSEDIGIKLTVTPRINNKGYITLTVEQEIQTNDGYTELNGSQYPLLNTRKMGADVAVQSGETVVLGGLAQNSVTKSATKVPILGDIPLLGWLFRHEADEHTRTEIIVFLTPRVLDTPAQMEDDARNTKASLDTNGVWDPTWSSSRLADPLPEKAAQKVLENGRSTVGAPRYPLTGYLTGLNSATNLPDVSESEPIRQAMGRAAAENKIPYVHYSDVDAYNRIRAANFRASEETTVVGKPEAAEPAPLSAEPAAPAEPAIPDEPAAPAEPAIPDEPAAPAEPVVPDEPAASDEPEKEPDVKDPEPERKEANVPSGLQSIWIEDPVEAPILARPDFSQLTQLRDR